MRKALEIEVKTSGQLLDKSGVRSHVVASDKYPGSFQTSALNRGIVERHIVRLREDFVSIYTINGFIGWVSDLSLVMKQGRFSQVWRRELIDDLEASDICLFADVLSLDDSPPLFFGAADCRVLEAMIAGKMMMLRRLLNIMQMLERGGRRLLLSLC